MKQMYAASADENGFVINYDEAYNLIKETYGSSMKITEDCKITDWQGAKKHTIFRKILVLTWVNIKTSVKKTW